MIAFLLAWTCLQGAPEPDFSGPQPDEGTPHFSVLMLNGPQKGRRIDYVERWRGSATLYVFLHEVSRPTGRLVRLIDEYAATKRERLNTLLVTLTADTLTGELEIPRTLQSLKIKNPCGVSVDGKEGPGAWGLNKDMAITAVLAVDGVVVANWALRSPNETDFDRIRVELDKVAEPKLETLEDLRAELLRQQEQIRALQREVALLKQAQHRAAPGGEAGRKRAGGADGPAGDRGKDGMGDDQGRRSQDRRAERSRRDDVAASSGRKPRSGRAVPRVQRR